MGVRMRRRIFSEDHDLFRQAVRTFVEREIKPHQERWNEDGIVDREAWRKAGQAGLLCTWLPEDVGGPGGDFKILPIAPPTFQPMTQATPVNQINPFVLQPYTPMQAQNIGASRVAQGIQGVSPTGAALGRQI